jgi:hypothetical protein
MALVSLEQAVFSGCEICHIAGYMTRSKQIHVYSSERSKFDLRQREMPVWFSLFLVRVHGICGDTIVGKGRKKFSNVYGDKGDGTLDEA